MKVVELYLTIETPDDIEAIESRVTGEIFKLLRRDEKLLGWQVGGQIELFDPQDPRGI